MNQVSGERLIVVGCSLGGSCAIEIARAAPDRVAALLLIGTKAADRPEPDLHAAALETLRRQGMEEAWRRYWAPLFSPSADRRVFAAVERMALAQAPEAVARGVTAFHTRPSRIGFLAAFRQSVVFVTGADDELSRTGSADRRPSHGQQSTRGPRGGAANAMAAASDPH